MHRWVYTRAEKSRWWRHGLIHGWDYRRVGLLTEFYGMYEIVHNNKKANIRLQCSRSHQFCDQDECWLLLLWTLRFEEIVEFENVGMLEHFHHLSLFLEAIDVCFAVTAVLKPKEKNGRSPTVWKKKKVNEGSYNCSYIKIIVLGGVWSVHPNLAPNIEGFHTFHLTDIPVIRKSICILRVPRCQIFQSTDNDFHWMNAGDGAQYLPGGEVERVTT